MVRGERCESKCGSGMDGSPVSPFLATQDGIILSVFLFLGENFAHTGNRTATGQMVSLGMAKSKSVVGWLPSRSTVQDHH